MRDTLADDEATLFVYGDADSVTPDPDFVLITITGHALKVSRGKGIGGQQLFKHNIFGLNLYLSW
jgi:hypothetical protein